MTSEHRRKVTLRYPFKLAGMDKLHPGGTFEIMVDTVELDVPWQAQRESLTLLLRRGSHIEAWPITGQELDSLVAADLQKSSDTGRS